MSASLPRHLSHSGVLIHTAGCVPSEPSFYCVHVYHTLYVRIIKADFPEMTEYSLFQLSRHCTNYTVTCYAINYKCFTFKVKIYLPSFLPPDMYLTPPYKTHIKFFVHLYSYIGTNNRK